jgi:hypothetical protein
MWRKPPRLTISAAAHPRHSKSAHPVDPQGTPADLVYPWFITGGKKGTWMDRMDRMQDTEQGEPGEMCEMGMGWRVGEGT